MNRTDARLWLLVAIFLVLPGSAFAQTSSTGGTSPGSSSTTPGVPGGPVTDELDRPFVEPTPPPEPKKDDPPPEPPKDPNPEVTFFENKVRTQRVLYIIDRSGSMSIRDQNSTIDGGTIINNPTRLQVAKAETKRSIQGLTQSIDFNVIAFASGSTSYSGGGGLFGWLWGRPPSNSGSASGAVIMWKNKILVKATDGNKSSATTWVSGLTDTAATDAMSAFKVGFSHNPIPQVMFFLSDGIPNVNGGPNEVRSYVRSTNGGKTQVHTVWIGDRSRASEDFMGGLARENGGTFTRK